MMQISIEKSALLPIITHCNNVIEKKTTMPILSNVLLQAHDGNTLSLSATDMDMEIITTTPAHVVKPGAACVSGSLLRDIVRKLKDKDVINLTLIDNGDRLEIVSGRSRFELGCLPVEDFPTISSVELTHEFQMPVPNLRHLIDTTIKFISLEETRYNMSGVFFHYHEDNGSFLRAVSSDMHRLACAQCAAPENSKNMPPVIISRKTVNELLNLFEDADAQVQIALSPVRIEFKFTCKTYSARLTSRVIDAVFPEYADALCVPDDKKLIVNAKEFSDCIDRVGSVLSDKIRAIRLSANVTTATLSAASQESGSATEDLDISYSSNEPVEVCCNSRYILDVAQKIKTEEMELLLQDEDSSILIRPASDDSMIFILMPMQF